MAALLGFFSVVILVSDCIYSRISISVSDCNYWQLGRKSVPHVDLQSDCISHPTNDGRHLNPSAWRAMGLHAQDSGRCAPPFSPPKNCGRTISKQLYKFAKATTAQSTTNVYAE